MSVKSFVEECSKYGWNDGGLYPANFKKLYNEISEKYNLQKDEIFSGHNDYRYFLDKKIIDSLPDHEIVLEWEIIGDFGSCAECGAQLDPRYRLCPNCGSDEVALNLEQT